MNLKYFINLILLFCCITVQAGDWRTLEDGLEYKRIPLTDISRFSKLHVFRLDLKNYKLEVATDNNKSFVSRLAKKHQALLAINGGFFSTEATPLGLRIQQGKQITPIRKISWWGIFYIKNNKPYIVGHKQFKKSSHIHFAVQAGPRLLINKKIPSLKDGLAERTALAIDNKNRVIIVASEHAPIDTEALAAILKDLGAINALNLDGGSSTQLYADTKDLQLDIANFSKVTDAIIVLPRT